MCGPGRGHLPFDVVTAMQDLLVLQDHDATISRLRHRLTHLPERAALAEKEASLPDFAARLAGATGRRDDASRAQRRVEDELAGVEQKITDVVKTLYSGSVIAPREPQALQADGESLKRHKATLEDDLLVG